MLGAPKYTVNNNPGFFGCYLHEVVDIVSPLKPKKIFL
jgi:hypothetical protein